jgi:hypothetical protein
MPSTVRVGEMFGRLIRRSPITPFTDGNVDLVRFQVYQRHAGGLAMGSQRAVHGPLALAVVITAALAAAAGFLAGPIEASARAAPVILTRHDVRPSQGLRVASRGQHARMVIRRARRLRAFHARLHAEQVVQAHADQPVEPEPQSDVSAARFGLIKGAARYDQGPAGLRNDVPTFGFARKF